MYGSLIETVLIFLYLNFYFLVIAFLHRKKLKIIDLLIGSPAINSGPNRIIHIRDIIFWLKNCCRYIYNNLHGGKAESVNIQKSKSLISSRQ